jgi:hypothetical protein
MVELQQKYNLKPRETSTTISPPKKILLRNKENEEVVTKKTMEKQAAQTKQTVEKQVAQGKKFETKETKTKKAENIETQMIQVDIGGHPPFPNGSKHFSGHFGNLLFLAGFNFRGHFEGLNEFFSIYRFSMISKVMIDPPK